MKAARKTAPAADFLALRQQLLRDEGEVLHAYEDSLGFLTIGVGRLIDSRKGGGITHAEAMHLLDNDISRKVAEVRTALPWLPELDAPRQGVLFNMAFQLGTQGLLKFKRTLELVRGERWDEAARAMLQSKWATQTPARARRLANQMQFGRWT